MDSRRSAADHPLKLLALSPEFDGSRLRHTDISAARAALNRRPAPMPRCAGR
jgi:hypothetical protein